jgi:methionyl-tRNA formyltransferase
MGTPEFSVPSLKRLILDGHDVAAVITQPDKPAGRGKHLHTPPVKSLALEHHISVHQPSKIKNNEDVRTTFETVSPDACVVVAYGKILPQWLLQMPHLGCINVHASLLPKYRGAAPINWAIANGEQETGVTIMQMDEGMDTGPMLAKRSIAIVRYEIAPELSLRLSELGAELLSETLPLIAAGDLRPMPQDDRDATYAPLLKREHGLIDWNMSAIEIANRVRAFQPWPGMFTKFRGGRLMVWRAREIQITNSLAEVSAEPGTIQTIDAAGITVQTGSGVLLIEVIQMEGKRRMAAREFGNGVRLKPGDHMTQ